MPGLVPGIHVLSKGKQGVDGRVKPGHGKFPVFISRSGHPN